MPRRPMSSPPMPGGDPVYHVLTPFMTDGGPMPVWWTAARCPRTSSIPPAAPHGQIEGETARRSASGARPMRRACSRRRPISPIASGMPATSQASPPPIMSRLAAPVVIEADATPNPGGWPEGGQTVVDFPQQPSLLCHHLVWACGRADRRLFRLSHFQGPAALDLTAGTKSAHDARRFHFHPRAGARSRFRRRAAGGPGAGWRALYAGGVAAVFRAAEIAGFKGRRYQDVAFEILSRFAGDSFHRRRIEGRYRSRLCRLRRAPEIAPLGRP